MGVAFDRQAVELNLPDVELASIVGEGPVDPADRVLERPVKVDGLSTPSFFGRTKETFAWASKPRSRMLERLRLSLDHPLLETFPELETARTLRRSSGSSNESC